MSRCLALALTLAAPVAAAAEVHVDGRFYTVSPSYYSATVGELAVSVTDQAPWGTRVFVKSGFGGQSDDWTGGTSRRFHWEQARTVEAPATAPYTWTARFTQNLHERSQPWFYDEFDVIIILERPDGTQSFEYRAKLPQGSEIGGSESTATFAPLTVTRI